MAPSAERAGAAPTGPVGVAIVSFNSASRLEACLKPLVDDDRVVRIAVRDNGSTDATAHAIRVAAAASPKVVPVGDGRNVGFGAGVNEAARHLDAPYLLVCNPDTELVGDALGAMLERLGDPGVEMVGPRLELVDGTPDHAGARRAPTLRSSLLYGVPGLRSRSGYVDEQPGATVEAISGSCMLLDRAAFDELGGFDESYWMYGEDLDLCLRMRERGAAIGYACDARVVHHRGDGSAGQIRSFKVNWAFFDAMAIYYRQHLAPQRGRRVASAVVVTGIRSVALVAAARNEVARAAERRGERHPPSAAAAV